MSYLDKQICKTDTDGNLEWTDFILIRFAGNNSWFTKPNENLFVEQARPKCLYGLDTERNRATFS